MEKLKDLLNQSKKLNEAKNPSFEAGYQTGPNGNGRLDKTSKEGKYVSDKINKLYSLLNDKTLIDFAKGYVDSISSSQYRYEGLDTVAKVLLDVKNR